MNTGNEFYFASQNKIQKSKNTSKHCAKQIQLISKNLLKRGTGCILEPAQISYNLILESAQKRYRLYFINPLKLTAT